MHIFRGQIEWFETLWNDRLWEIKYLSSCLSRVFPFLSACLGIAAALFFIKRGCLLSDFITAAKNSKQKMKTGWGGGGGQTETTMKT